MSAKRACMDRTSGVTAEMELLEQEQPIQSAEKRKVAVSSIECLPRPTKNLKLTAGRREFTRNNVISSAHSRRSGLLGTLLEVCFFCKKKLSDNIDIFMYRDFCAFCSPECRAMQMFVDMKEAKNKSTAKKAA